MNTSLNQVTVFIVLGIAADDVFVFCDAWNQGALIPLVAQDEKRRIAYAFKRSFRAITITSSTTAVAFFASASSDLRPIRAFGIFAGLIVPVNFLIVIFMMPSICVIHDRYLKPRFTYGQCLSKLNCYRKKSSLPSPAAKVVPELPNVATAKSQPDNFNMSSQMTSNDRKNGEASHNIMKSLDKLQSKNHL